MHRRRLLILALAAWPAAAQAQAVRLLGSEAEGFARVEPGRAILFPRDHGAHPAFRIEWWYLTANLRDGDGAPLGLQWTLFRVALSPDQTGQGWSEPQLWLGHAAVTTGQVHRAAERLARGGVGQAGAVAEPFAAWIDEWRMASLGPPFSPLGLTASGPDFSYDLRLEAQGPMVLQGQGGYSVKSDRGHASHYVSQPFLSAAGTVTIDGKAHAVTGRAWMDREWSSQPLDPDQTGWDWVSLHLPAGEKLMAFRLRSAAGAAYTTGNWIAADGGSTPLAPGAVTLTPLAQGEVAGRLLPLRWRIEVPGRALRIETEPVNPLAWNALGTAYWEGPITFAGTHPGEGYLEMTGY